MANMLRADFYGWRNVGGLAGATVRQKFGNHTLFFLDYNISQNQRFLLPPENTPFQMVMGSGPLTTSTFYGYVNHHEDNVDPTGKRITRLVGIGTSKVMNTASLTTWQGQSRSGIVREIGARHRFRTVVHGHNEGLEHWSTGTMSDWKAANALADEIGYRLWVDGPTMWLLDPQKTLASASVSTTKTVRRSAQTDANVFRGSNVPGQVAASKRLVHYGVSGTSNGLVAASTGDPDLPVEMLSAPISTYSEAQFAAQAEGRIRGDQAVVDSTIAGDPTLTPGTPIRFAEDEGTSEQSGLWLINYAEHTLTQREFSSRISASRDVDRPLLSRIPDIVRRESAQAKAVVRNGKTWEAEVQEHVHA